MPSVASLINYRDAGPETFHCPHETCVKVFYSKQNLDSHFKVKWNHDLRDEECICEGFCTCRNTVTCYVNSVARVSQTSSGYTATFEQFISSSIHAV